MSPTAGDSVLVLCGGAVAGSSCDWGRSGSGWQLGAYRNADLGSTPPTNPLDNPLILEMMMADAATKPDVVDQLTSDHHEVLQLLDKVKSSTDHNRRKDVAEVIIGELVRHSVAEEMFVYPEMRRHLPDGDVAVEHDVAEHKELERLMKEWEDADPSTAEFDRVLGKLEVVLRDHVNDEENEQFPLLRSHIPAEKLADLAEKVELAKRVAPTRPHPLAPNSALFHFAVGPGVGLVDRLRDAWTGRERQD